VLFAMLLIICAVSMQLQADESLRKRVLQLLNSIHSADETVRTEAYRELADLGIREDRLRYARLLKHPQRIARLKLVQQLISIPEPLRTDLRTELLRDQDRHVRAAVVGTLTPQLLTADIRKQLVDLQKIEQDPLLRFRIQQLLNPDTVNIRRVERVAPPESTAAARALSVRQPPRGRISRPVNSDSTIRSTESTPGLSERIGPPENHRAVRKRATAETPVSMLRPDQIPSVEITAAEPLKVAVADAGPVDALAQPAGASESADSALPQPSGESLTVDELFQTETLPRLQPFTTTRRPPGHNPAILDRPLDEPSERTPPAGVIEQTAGWVTPEPQAPYGFSGPTGILPSEVQEDAHFVPQPDRWRNGYDKWDRYGTDHPWVDDYPGVEGHWWDPYNQNVLKGDYPIVGQHTFFNMTATNLFSVDYRQSPTGTSPFESTRSANQNEFFGNNNSTFLNETLFLRMDLFHGAQTGFKPLDWMLRVTPTVNMNQLHVQELALINPDVTRGRTRHRDHFVLQEYFAEAKLADISPDYDFASVRAGNQFFNSDFRGFIFFDTNRAIRLFGSRLSNRHQFNLLFYDMVEKDTNSGLNTTSDRHQNVLIGNYYIQDFIFPGYTFQTSFHWNNDQPSMRFDRNNFLVRPDPAGIFQKHRVESYYFGIAGDGHMGRINVNNAFYWATGRDSLNPIGGQPVDINAYMAAIELSYDRDWARFRASLFWSSGDDDPNDGDAEGFDSIIDNPAFAGGEFSYWQRQAIQLFGVRLVNDRSLVPDLRSSGIQGQSNFTNPGLFLFNLGLDLDLTPKLRMIMNANYLMFDETEVLQAFTFQGDIDKEIGLDLSCGFEWRPFHNDNMILLFGASALIPDEGFKDLYAEFNDGDTETLFASFCDMILTY